MKSDEQNSPDEVDPLTEAMGTISTANTTILRLCKEDLGDYLQIAYEWSWVEVMNMVEVLDVKDEHSERASNKAEAESRADRS